MLTLHTYLLRSGFSPRRNTVRSASVILFLRQQIGAVVLSDSGAVEHSSNLDACYEGEIL